eukprot:4759949-Amphidinium_carterae.1
MLLATPQLWKYHLQLATPDKSCIVSCIPLVPHRQLIQAPHPRCRGVDAKRSPGGPHTQVQNEDGNSILRCELEVEWCGKCNAYHCYLHMIDKSTPKNFVDLLSAIQRNCPDSASYMRVALALSVAQGLSKHASSWKSPSGSKLKVTLGVAAKCKGGTTKPATVCEPMSTGISFDGSRSFMAVKGHCIEYDSDADSIPPPASHGVATALAWTN